MAGRIFTKCSWCVPLLFAVAAGVIPAQEPLITPETPVDSVTLHQWLHSSDPRLVAWAADFARRRHEADLIAEMPALLEHWTMLPLFGGYESQQAERRAVLAVLDTLIQENVKLPIPAIKAVAQSFPAQASILIARLPLSESRVTLNDWSIESTRAYWTAPALARIATMMLAKDPGTSQGILNGNTAGLVASVVAASEEELQITVSSSNTSQLRVKGGNTCGDSFGLKLTPGWPQVYAYDLVENDPQMSAPLVVDLDGDRIVSRRFEENAPWGSCYGIQWLTPTTRHRIIAHWLGVPNNEMPWQPVEYFTIMWTGKAEYQRQLGKIVETEREKLRATVETLRQRGFLREAETANLSPRLLVKVQCEIKPCPLD